MRTNYPPDKWEEKLSFSCRYNSYAMHIDISTDSCALYVKFVAGDQETIEPICYSVRARVCVGVC